MILFTILAFIGALLLVGAVLIISVGGAAFIGIFADLIVCILIIGFLIKLIFKRRRRRR